MHANTWHASGGFTVTGVLLGVLALAACGPASTTSSIAERFAAAVESADRDHEPLTIADSTRSEWDRGVMVCPDDPVDAVESLLGVRWRDAPSTDDDGVAYVVFAAGDGVVDAIRLDRSVVDPCSGTSLLSVRSFGPTTGVFRVDAMASGGGWTIGPNG